MAKQEVFEKKRPYFRHALKTPHIVPDLDLGQIRKPRTAGDLARRVREKAESGTRFSIARGGNRISHVATWTGDGREWKEQRIGLTDPQGLFLYQLPFPNAEPLSIADILRKAGVSEELAPEILDLVDVLARHDSVEVLEP